jgi:hypothetical protein
VQEKVPTWRLFQRKSKRTDTVTDLRIELVEGRPDLLYTPADAEKAAQGASDLFVSAKTAAAIPARHPALRDALIQASLDPQVCCIAYVASASIASKEVELDAVVVQRDEGRVLRDIVAAWRICDVEEQGFVQIALTELGLKQIVLTVEEIEREPRCGNARLVWSYRKSPVSVGLRMRILQTRLDDGPMPLGDLLKSIRSERDPAPAVMALACADLLNLDLVSQPLGPATVVRYRT